jgi:ABC-type antimicrobial peptide transport system permease subunit
MLFVVVGVAIGLGVAIITSHALITFLFGISNLDPITYVAVIALLLGVSGIACFVPARRAASVNPVEILQSINRSSFSRT